MSNEPVVGIDLGTTNSEVAGLVGGRVEVLGPASGQILPSVVGVTPTDELLVGLAARRQLLAYPERTVRSIKRKMGTDERVTLGNRELSPPEVSALILRALAETASQALGCPVRRAVITVPAYFSDAQRQATREAGALADLEVLRILNEPTAASLAYGSSPDRRTVLVYDLGGGTFDVSIVRMEGEVTEVLASHGDNNLGGDDLDQLVADLLAEEFADRHGIDLRQDPASRVRLLWAAEAARRQLSDEPHAWVREEAIAHDGKVPLHLERELDREEFEALAAPLFDRTLEAVDQALDDASLRPSELAAILLVGGATRTPRVSRLLQQRTGLEPRHEVHPDLCVALGAGVLASRLAGHAVERVLVDVSPYSFGPSHLGERGGVPYPYCYRPVIARNTPLPVTRSERYFTSAPHQTSVHLEIFQGEDDDALRNLRIGAFTVEGLRPVHEPNEVLVRMGLDIDGILQVTAIEKATGLSRQITIERAARPPDPGELEASRRRLEHLYASRLEGADDDAFAEGEEEEEEEQEWVRAAMIETPTSDSGAEPEVSNDPQAEQARRLLARSRGLLDRMHVEDREEAVELHQTIEEALDSGDGAALESATASLKEMLFFVEGR